MTTTLKCHFDGKVLVPDEPVSLPTNTPLTVVVNETATRGEVTIVPATEPGPEKSIKAMLESDAIGSWAHRTDIGDSVEYARELRRKVSRREHE